MPLLLEKFIGFFLWIESQGQRGLFTVCHVSTERTILIFFPPLHMCVWPESCGGGRETITQRFITIVWGILFIHGGFHYRHQVKSDQQGLYWLFYVFTLTEINNSHNIVGRLLMSWLTLMFSSFPLTYKNSKLAVSSSDFEGCENLTSPTCARVNLLKVSVSEYFLSQFLGQEDKIDLNQFTITKRPLFYMRLKKVSKLQHLSLRQHQKIYHVLTKTTKII